MKNNMKPLKTFSIIFILLLSAVSVSALSLIGEFDNRQSTKSIMPGDSTGYFILVSADQTLQRLNTSAKFYDITTGEKVFLKNLFSYSTVETFFFPPEFFIESGDYQNLPGEYIIEVTTQEVLASGYTEKKTIELKLTVIGNRPPVADFVYAPTRDITTKTPVTFTSKSYDTDGYLVRQEWFSNSIKIGEGATFVYTFPNEGTYNITLKVTDNDGGTDTHSDTVTVTKATPTGYPVADFSFTPSSPYEGDNVKFTSTSYDVDGTIVKEEWDFNNDGVYEVTGHAPSKVFTASGEYIVWLKVTDNDGLQATTSKTVVVKEKIVIPNKAPVANFTYTYNSGGVSACVGETVKFTSTSFDSDGAIVKEEWDLNNDGIFTATGHTYSKVYDAPGEYKATLRVTDDDGAQTSISKTISVKSCEAPNKAPVANFSYTYVSGGSNACVGETVKFTSTSFDSDGSIVKEEWDLNNDGVFSASGHTYSKAFTSAGTYKISLRVTDDDGAQTTISKTLSVVVCEAPNKAPVANFTYSPMGSCANETVKFTSTSYDSDGTIVSQRWFVDGKYLDSGVTFSYKFSGMGNYEVSLTVVDDDGASDSEEKIISISCTGNIPPVAQFTYSPSTNITVGKPVDFVSTSYDVDGTIVSYRWLVDGNFVSSEKEFSYVFSTEGAHKVSLTVVDDDGASDSEEKTIMVVALPANIPPVPDFTYDPLNPFVNDTVNFVSISYDPDGFIVLYEWFIDGMPVSNSEDMSRIFSNSGSYNVGLRVTDNDGASAEAGKIIVISDKPVLCSPEAVLVMPESFLMNTIVKMDGSLSKAGCNSTLSYYRWQIFRGTEQVAEFTTVIPYQYYNFTRNGEYRVVLTVYASNGLSDSDEKIVFAGRPAIGINTGSEDGLYVDYYEVTGCDYGVIRCGDDFIVTATVSNDRDEDIEDLRITFAIPELGYKIKSEAFDLDSGDTKTVSMHGYLDFMEGEVPPGEYIALIGASDTDTIRVKYFPLIITN